MIIVSVVYAYFPTISWTKCGTITIIIVILVYADFPPQFHGQIVEMVIESRVFRLKVKVIILFIAIYYERFSDTIIINSIKGIITM